MVLVILVLLAGGWLWGQQETEKPRAVLLLIGPPGAGKGTQAEFITKKFGIPSISTGALLRAEVKAETDLGKRIQSAMAKGELVSDQVVNQLVVKRIEQPDAAKGFILDGYPRTVAQAEFLDKLLAGRKIPRPTVLHLAVPDSVVMARLLARGRADDKPEVIRDRLKVYENETRPLLSFYAGGDLHRIDGTGTPEEVFQRIERVIGPKFND